ncbi:hypothetical protein NSTC731_06089 [Nostoc sp. DSM 114167]|jgi:hypothetical protein
MVYNPVKLTSSLQKRHRLLSEFMQVEKVIKRSLGNDNAVIFSYF